MPQASDELRQEWGGEQGIAEDKAEDFLAERGIVIRHFMFFIEKDRVLTSREVRAIQFLQDEWDYGSVVRR